MKWYVTLRLTTTQNIRNTRFIEHLLRQLTKAVCVYNYIKSTKTGQPLQT